MSPHCTYINKSINIQVYNVFNIEESFIFVFLNFSFLKFENVVKDGYMQKE